jgi:hypothetical protein
LIDLTEKKLKLLFFEICNGYSKLLDKDNKTYIYIKHFGEFTSGEFEEYFFEQYEIAKKKGLPTLAEKEKFLIDQDYWTKTQNEELKYKQEKLQKLEKSYADLFLKSHMDKAKKEITELRKNVKALEDEKKDLLGMHAETYAQNKLEYFYILNSFYKDKELKEKLFDFYNEDVDSNSYYQYIVLHNKIIEKFNINHIKALGLSNSFQNIINVSDENCYYLFGKPIYHLTYYQNSIFTYGKYFSNILSMQEAKKLDTATKTNPDKLLEWYNALVNFKSKRPNSSGKGMSFVMGANKEDMEYLKQDVKNDMNDIAKAQGGKLGIQELAKLSKI